MMKTPKKLAAMKSALIALLAFCVCAPLISNGEDSPRGFTELGIRFANGDGVKKDDEKAFTFFRAAAKAGEPVAQYNLGYFYSIGRGVERDSAMAAMWIHKSAENGNTYAQNQFAGMLYRGEGMKPSKVDALKYFKKAAEGGNFEAQTNYGMFLLKGEGGAEKDPKKAAIWVRKAANQEFARAQFYMGMMYAEGQGLLKDYEYAYAWFNIASLNGAKDAKHNLNELSKSMTTEQISTAQKLSREILGLIKRKKQSKPANSLNAPSIDPNTGLPIW